MREFLQREGSLTKNQIKRILYQTLPILKGEPNLIKIEEPVCIVGDIHGQYSDLVNVLKKVGDPEAMSYLFLGDYVDRGMFGIEVCILLFCLKQNNPKTVILL